MQIHGYAAFKAKGLLEPFSYTAPELKPFEVIIKISHSGICRTDLHMIDNAWNRSIYPLVPGHEIVGTVIQKGVFASLPIGERVAVGWIYASCLDCPECLQENTNICQHKTSIYNHGRYGGFADHVIADSRFCFRLPKELNGADAAPLLCAGATVFSPLIHHKIQANHAVGIIGIGGLGHLALQFCKAFGCETSAISSTPSKEKEAKECGAQHFYTFQNPPSPTQFHFLLCSVDVELNWNQILSWLKPNGVLCLVSRPPKNFNFDPSLLVSTQRTICGSNNANRFLVNEMLSFATRHQIKPKVEVVPLSKVNEALEKLRTHQARYRIVLENLTNDTALG